MRTTIEIINSLSESKIIEIENKGSLKNKYSQDILADNHSIPNNSRTIRCGCNDFKDALYLSNKKIANKYYLALYPKSKEHSFDCPFNTLISSLIEDSNGETAYSISIFDEVINELEKKQYSSSDFERAKANTFNSLYRIAINNATEKLFNILKDDKFFFKKQSFKIFCDLYEKELKSTNIKGGVSFFDLNKVIQGFYYSYGIIDNEINFDAIEKLKDEDDVDISFRRVYYSVEKKRHLLADSKKYSITKKKLLTSLKGLKIFNHYIKPPYFYNATMIYGKITRLHLYPVFFDSKQDVITFIESDYERNYAKKLFNQNTLFFKPITELNSELLDNKISDVRYRPDFIEVDKNKIKIIEVSGFDNLEEYQNLMRDKIENYESLQNNDISFEVVRGRDINNDSIDSWDGLEMLTFGKYLGQTWDSVPNSTLVYYINNFDSGDNKNKAYYEFTRRKANM